MGDNNACRLHFFPVQAKELVHAMAHLTKKTVRGEEYPYLRHTYWDGEKTRAVEMGVKKYIQDGRMAEAREELSKRVFKERWLATLEGIKQAHDDQIKELPRPALEKYFEDFGLRFTYNTNRIEGSTLTFQETRDVVILGRTPPNKPSGDVIEAASHMAVFRDMLAEEAPLSLELLAGWHRKLFELTKPDIAGSTRKTPVIITGAKHVPPARGFEVDHHLEELWDWHGLHEQLLHPVFLAAIMKFRFVSIHPFNDGNGRVSRLLMNYILHRSGYPMFNILEKHRRGYYRALDRANTNQDELHFMVWFCGHYIKEAMTFFRTG